MSQPWPWLLLAIVASAAWLARPRRSVIDGGLTVTGGSVSIDASNPVETRAVWEWIGPAGSYVWPTGMLAGGKPAWGDLTLRPGAYYDRSFVLDQKITGAEFRPVSGDKPDNLSALWPTWWRRQILTAQEQIVLSVTSVPATLS